MAKDMSFYNLATDDSEKAKNIDRKQENILRIKLNKLPMLMFPMTGHDNF